jgi:hypothetical protein
MMLHARVGEFSRVRPGAHIVPDSACSWRWWVSAAVSSEHVDVRVVEVHLDVRTVEARDVLVIWVDGGLRMFAWW